MNPDIHPDKMAQRSRRYRHICICGGGGLGLVCAAVASAQGFDISLLTGHPASWHREIHVTDLSGKRYDGTLATVTSDPSEAVADADIVLLCVPGFLIEKTLCDIKPFVQHNAPVGAIVSSTGFFFDAHRVFGADSSQPLFGFQRVPFIARNDCYGHSASLLGYKPSLNMAIENLPEPHLLADALAEAFITPINLLQNFYEASLTNSNPILHTGRLYSLWGPEADPAMKTHPSLFYADWTDDASRTILTMDAEFMELLGVLGIRKGAIPSLLEYYESYDAPSLTRKIRSIEAFKEIASPMRRNTDGSLSPDTGSRYFTEDFPFGLKIIAELAKTHCVATPMIDKVLAWGLSVI